jgi:hypothetical protein
LPPANARLVDRDDITGWNTAIRALLADRDRYEIDAASRRAANVAWFAWSAAGMMDGYSRVS